MLYFTQLIYVHAGQEPVFQEFEDIVLPLIAKYDGQLLLRLRPTPESVIESAAETPYEVHLVQFTDESGFRRFAQDEERQRFLHLKEASVRATLLIQGQVL
jgi:uncharacterized protein (DUF1330 family)